jgi:hypothetical protein
MLGGWEIGGENSWGQLTTNGCLNKVGQSS